MLFVGCGLVAWRSRPDSREGPILVAGGFTWFAGNFSVSAAPGLSSLASITAFVYIGFLAHA
ncbi:MAG: hypothetical protein ACHQ15_07720, partial [Candidatus Limnocylindrales bacterium]